METKSGGSIILDTYIINREDETKIEVLDIDKEENIKITLKTNKNKFISLYMTPKQAYYLFNNSVLNCLGNGINTISDFDIIYSMNDNNIDNIIKLIKNKISYKIHNNKRYMILNNIIKINKDESGMYIILNFNIKYGFIDTYDDIFKLYNPKIKIKPIKIHISDIAKFLNFAMKF